MINGLDKIKVDTGSVPYFIHFRDSFDDLTELLKEKGYTYQTKINVVTDSNVGPLYYDKLKTALSDFEDVSCFQFEAGEESKTLKTIEEGFRFLVENKSDRKSIILALGGGVVGDLAGFLASTYMRGIDYIQIPTTLLAQVDSSVGGKTGFDFLGFKNMIGSFYQPQFVYMNLKTLSTLPEVEFNAGLAEAVKHGLIMDDNYLEFIEMNADEIRELNIEKLVTLVQGSCKIKSDVVAEDEKETGLREILNFGHTVGHAVETYYDFNRLHGECVAIGMIAALHLSLAKGYLNQETLERVKSLLTRFDLPTHAKELDIDAVYKNLFHDKKVKNGQLSFVLLNKIGMPIQNVDVEKELIEETLKYLKTES